LNPFPLKLLEDPVPAAGRSGEKGDSPNFGTNGPGLGRWGPPKAPTRSGGRAGLLVETAGGIAAEAGLAIQPVETLTYSAQFIQDRSEQLLGGR